MLSADPEASNARAARVLALAWVAFVPAWWMGMVVASMDAEAPRRIAIDLDGYFLPRYVWASEMLARGVLPLWNPYELVGVPMLGAGQGAVLYPLRMLLFGALPPTLALHAFFVVHYLLLGVGSWVALRTLRLGWAGAALGAVIVTFQPFMLHGHYAPHWISNFVWTPFAVAAFVALIERPSGRAAVGLATALSLQVYAGYPEYAFDTVLALAVLCPFVARRAMTDGGPGVLGRAAAWLGIAAVLTVLTTAVQVVALVETVRESVRAAGEYQFMFGMTFDRTAFAAGMRGWVDALGLLFYVPPIGWALLGVGVLAGGTRHRAAMLTFAALAWAAPTWLRDAPPFSLFRGPLCWHSMLHLPLAAFAGAGLDRVLATDDGGGGARRPWVRWAIVVSVSAVLAPILSPRAVLWTLLGVAGLWVAARRHRPAIGTILVIGSALGTILTWVPGATPSLAHRWAADEPDYPRVAERRAEGAALRAACGEAAAGRILAPRETWLGIPLLAGMATPQGYPESLAPRRTSRLLAEAGLAPHAVFPLDRTRLLASRPILELLDVRCLVLPRGWDSVADALGYGAAGRLPDGRVARVRDGRAAWMVEGVESVASDEAAFTRVTAPEFAAHARAVVVGTSRAAASRVGAGRVDSVGRPEPGRIVVRVVAPDGGYLVVPETWYPGWRATVDGVPLPVERADYAFLGLAVPAGATEVDLRYVPRGFGWAMRATLLGAVLLLGTAVATRPAGRGA